MFIDKTEKETILKPLQTIIGIVERKQTLPILSNVLLEKKDGNLRFTATDLEIQITTVAKLASSEDHSASLTVSGKKILEILKILPDQTTVSLEAKENRAIVKCHKSKFTLQTLPAQDFPKIPDQFESARTIRLPQAQLKSLLESVQYAMAHQDVRYYLNGILLIIENGKLKAVATDGHRLAYNEVGIEDNYPRTDLILPRKAVTELCRLLGNTEDSVELAFTAQQIKAIFSGVELITKIIEGKFPDYERVIPKYDNQLTMDRTLIQQALQRASILSNEKFRGVRFLLTERTLTIISSNSEQEEAQEELEADYHGNALDIGFNVNYLLDGINNIANNVVTFSFGDPNSSILITNPENAEFRYVVMPMRI